MCITTLLVIRKASEIILGKGPAWDLQHGSGVVNVSFSVLF